MSLVTIQRSQSTTCAPDSRELVHLSTPPKSASGPGSRQRRSKSALKRLRKLFNTVRFVTKLRHSESYFTVKGAALIIPQGECIRNITKGEHVTGGDIQNHLQSMFYLLRQEDTIKVAVKLECSGNNIRYMAVVSCIGSSNREESVILGFDCNEEVTIGLVLPLWADTSVRLDGDGGFFVVSNLTQRIFKPVSVQAMWSMLQSLHKCCEISHREGYHPGGSSHEWLEYYYSRFNSSQDMINEWEMMEDLWSQRRVLEGTDEEIVLKKRMSDGLRKIMMTVDLDEVTGRFLRESLEKKLGMGLKEYRGFIDQESLLILGQMDSASEIFNFLYLGTEWNAGNLEELKKNGITHILNCTREIDNFFPGMFEYMNVREYDVEETDLLKYWDKTYRFIHKARMAGKHVFVHCKMGISRSASTVVAYIMKVFGWSLEKTMGYVADRRPIIKPNPSFMKQLETYKGILDASGQRHNALWKPIYRSKSDTDLQSKSMGMSQDESDDSEEEDDDEPLNLKADPEVIFDTFSSASEGDDQPGSTDEEYLDATSQQDEDDICLPRNTLTSKTTDLTSKHARLLDSHSRFKSFQSSPLHSPQKSRRTRRVSSLPDLHQMDEEDDLESMAALSSTWTADKLTATPGKVKPDDYWIRGGESGMGSPEVAEDLLRRGSFEGAPMFGIDLQMEFSDYADTSEAVGSDDTGGVEETEAQDGVRLRSLSPGAVLKQKEMIEKGQNVQQNDSSVEKNVPKKRRSGVVSMDTNVMDVANVQISNESENVTEETADIGELNSNCNANSSCSELQIDSESPRKDSRPPPGFVQRTLEGIEGKNTQSDLAYGLTALTLANDQTVSEQQQIDLTATVQRSQSLKTKRVTANAEETASVSSTSKSEESIPSMTSSELLPSVKRQKTSADVVTGETNLGLKDEMGDSGVGDVTCRDQWSETIAPKIRQEEVPLEPGNVKRRTMDFEQQSSSAPSDTDSAMSESSPTRALKLEHRMNPETLHLIREIGSCIVGNIGTPEVAEEDWKATRGLVRRITMAIEKKEGNDGEMNPGNTSSLAKDMLMMDNELENVKNDEKLLADVCDSAVNFHTESQSVGNVGVEEIEYLESSKTVSKLLSQFAENNAPVEKSVVETPKVSDQTAEKTRISKQPSVDMDELLREKESYVQRRRSQFEENKNPSVDRTGSVSEDVDSVDVFHGAALTSAEKAESLGSEEGVVDDTSVKDLVGKFETKQISAPQASAVKLQAIPVRPMVIESLETSCSSLNRSQSLKIQKTPSPPWNEAAGDPLSRERASSWSEKHRGTKAPFHRSASDRFDPLLIAPDENVKVRQQHGKTHPLAKLAERKSAGQLGDKTFYL